jgi:Chlorophyll A-B binding protein
VLDDSGRYDSLQTSVAFPSLPRPPHLDGSHAGDFGFDPLGLSEQYDLYYMQECETRHARLAMLAVVGFPLSEMVGPHWLLQEDGRAPSVLNGFNIGSALAVVLTFSMAGAFEYFTSLRRTAETELGEAHRSDMKNIWPERNNLGVAGDYDFDPAGLYSSLGNDAWGRKGMRELEIVQGRWAMLGITGMAFQEAVTGKPVTETSSLFFSPNLIVPVAAMAAFAWSQFYEVSHFSEYPVRVQYNKDGEQRMRDLRRNLGLDSEDSV